MARLSLAMLGPLQIMVDMQPAQGFVYNKARALLIYLMMEADRPHTRDALVGLLWPELPDAAARTNLRQALAKLRVVIGDANSHPPMLLITRETIQFNPRSDYELDLKSFVQLLTECDEHSHRRPERCRSCATRIERALALYRGDFLAEFTLSDSAAFGEWQTVHRERLHQRAVAALAQLSAYHEWCGSLDRALQTLQRHIELEPWREDIHRRIMRVLVSLGESSAALAQYERCRWALADTFGIEPESETIALYHDIRSGSTSHQLLTSHDQARSTRTFIRHNLPAQLMPLIGRERELESLAHLLEGQTPRLITLVGVGGIGKTRLALQVAQEHAGSFKDGCCLVSLAAVGSPALMGQAITDALRSYFRQSSAADADVCDILREKELLLVLDNLEHLHAGAFLLTRILQAAPAVTLLVTSQVRLQLEGEWIIQLFGLPCPHPDRLHEIQASPAVQLFLQSAQRARGHFTPSISQWADIARICRALDGLPLGIELAAAWTRTLLPAEIVDEIRQGIDILQHPARASSERHQSIRVVLEYTWSLLNVREQQVVRALAVFRGGFLRHQAEQVAGASLELLRALTDKSLVQRQPDGRFYLHELVRRYVEMQLLQAGELELIRYRHLQCFVELAEQIEPNLYGSDRRSWQQVLDCEYENLQAGLAWAVQRGERALSIGSAQIIQVPGDAHPSASELGTRMVAALSRFWYLSVRWQEGRDWLRTFSALVTQATPLQTRARLMTGAGVLANAQGDYVSAVDMLQSGLALFRELHDSAGVAYTLQELAEVIAGQGEYGRASAMLAEALSHYRARGDSLWIAQVLYRLASLADDQGETEHAIVLAEEALVIYRVLDDRIAIATVLNILGQAVAALGQYQRAVQHFEESIRLYQTEKGRQACAWPLGNLAAVLLSQGDAVQAMTLYQESLSWRWFTRNTGGCAWCLEGLAAATAAVGQPKRAARLWGAAEQLRIQTGAKLSPIHQDRHNYYVAIAHSQMHPANFSAAWAAGALMQLEEMVAYGLSSADCAED